MSHLKSWSRAAGARPGSDQVARPVQRDCFTMAYPDGGGDPSKHLHIHSSAPLLVLAQRPHPILALFLKPTLTEAALSAPVS